MLFFQPKKRHLNLLGTCFESRLPCKILQVEYHIIGICPHSHSQWVVTLTKAFRNYCMYLYHFKGGFWASEQDWTRPFKRNSPPLSLSLSLSLSLFGTYTVHVIIRFILLHSLTILYSTCRLHDHADCVRVAEAQNKIHHINLDLSYLKFRLLSNPSSKTLFATWNWHLLQLTLLLPQP